MNKLWFNPSAKVTFSNPGANWIFSFVKNSSRSKAFRLLTNAPEVCSATLVSWNVNVSADPGVS